MEGRHQKRARGSGDSDNSHDSILRVELPVTNPPLEEDHQLPVPPTNGGGNPMLEPVVLKRFFELCELSDLRRFRLVCSQWYDLSLTRWRSKMTLGIVNQYPDDKSEPLGNGRRKLKWNNAFRLYEWSRYNQKPYQSYCLFDSSFANEVPLPHQEPGAHVRNKETFWKKIGPSMRRLELHSSLIFKAGVLERVIFEETPNLESLTFNKIRWNSVGNMSTRGEVKVQPNLKHLKIHQIEDRFPIPWRVLFDHFPNIERLELAGFRRPILLPLMFTLEEIREASKLPNVIKHLDLSQLVKQRGGVAKRLIELKQMKLESLYFPISTCEDRSMSVLPHALELFRETLTKLHLEIQPDLLDQPPRQYEINFPFTSAVFTTLTELTLEGAVSPNLHFLEQTPNLKVLHIGQQGGVEPSIIQGTSEAFFEKGLILAKIEEFHYYFIPEPVSTGPSIEKLELEKLARLMPNARWLKIPVTIEALSAVFENWKELRSLEITTDDLPDSSITGIVEGKEERIPNLTDLKYLYKLSIKDQSLLTDSSVYEGFLKMNHLRNLEVIMCEKTSNEAFSALFSRFPSTKVKRYEPSDSDSEEAVIEDEWWNSEMEEKAKRWSKEFGFP